MTPLLINHKSWTPSLKKFFNAYHSTIHFIGCQFSKRDPIARKWQGKYRTRNTWILQDGGYVQACHIYTNDIEMLEDLVSDNFYNEKIDYIATPRDQAHSELFSQSSETTEFRSKYYFDKYEYRLVSNVNYYRDPPDSDMVNTAVAHIRENFTDTRLAYNNGRYHMMRRTWFATPAPAVSKIVKFPTVYTNDKNQLFMFMMAYREELQLEVSRVVIV